MNRYEKKILSKLEKEEKNIEKSIEKLENIYNSEVRKLRNKTHRNAGELQDQLTTIGFEKQKLIEKSEKLNSLFYWNERPVRIFSKPPMTEVSWENGTKTRVTAAQGEKYDLEKGIAMAFLKKTVYETRSNYHLLREYFNEILITENSEEPETLDLGSMTVAELEEFAKNRFDMPIPNGIRKSDLINLIEYLINK
jgi:hypothetical protein